MPTTNYQSPFNWSELRKRVLRRQSSLAFTEAATVEMLILPSFLSCPFYCFESASLFTFHLWLLCIVSLTRLSWPETVFSFLLSKTLLPKFLLLRQLAKMKSNFGPKNKSLL